LTLSNPAFYFFKIKHVWKGKEPLHVNNQKFLCDSMIQQGLGRRENYWRQWAPMAFFLASSHLTALAYSDSHEEGREGILLVRNSHL
jgi:hypothetical protein